MNLISSSVSYQKYILGPVVIILGIAILAFYRSKEIGELGGVFDIVVYVMVPCSILIYIYKYWSLANEVWDSGHSLVFMRRGEKVEIPYSQIRSFKVCEKECDNDSEKEFFVNVKLNVNDKGLKAFKFKPATQGDAGRQPVDDVYEVAKNISLSKERHSKLR